MKLPPRFLELLKALVKFLRPTCLQIKFRYKLVDNDTFKSCFVGRSCCKLQFYKNRFLSGFVSNFTVKNIKTVPVNTTKHYYVVVFVLEEATFSNTAKMSSSVMVGKQGIFSLMTLAG